MSNKRCPAIFASLVFFGQITGLFAASALSPPGVPPNVNETGVSALSPDDILLLDADDDDEKSNPTTAPISPPGRHSFNLLDNRSSYGKDFFVNPFLGPDFDQETQIELDYLHAEKRHFQDNESDAELQWNPIGQLTLNAEFGWDSEHQTASGRGDGDAAEQQSADGVENVDLALNHPIFQFVTGDNLFDYTAVARLDLDIPTRTHVSGKDLQLTPYLGQLVRLGNHWCITAWSGSQFTIAPRQAPQFIYGASLGYQILHNQLPLPLTDTLIPLFELDGQRPFSQSGNDALFGVAGFDVNFTPIGPVQPILGLGYQFPIDNGARAALDWGIITQLSFEF